MLRSSGIIDRPYNHLFVGGAAPTQGTAADAGMRRGVQGQAAEAGGCVRATPRWAALRTGRGGGERVKREVFDDERLRMERR